MPSRFAFPRIRRFHPHDTTQHEDGMTSVNHTASNSSNSSEDHHSTAAGATSGPTSSTSRTRRTRGHGHRRHSRHSHSSSSSPSKPHAAASPIIHPAIQNFRLRWIDHDHEECAVCTKRFEIDCVVTLLPCGHYFCQPCMDQWFWKNHSSTCPLCRYDVAAANPCDDDDHEFDEEEVLEREYYDKWCHHATEKRNNGSHLAATSNNSTDYLSLVTKVVLTGDMIDAKCEKISDSLACDGVNATFGTNFDLIMAKALHARRARMAYETSSLMMDSFLREEDQD